MSSTYNLGKQFGPRSVPTTKKHEKLPSMKRVNSILLTLPQDDVTLFVVFCFCSASASNSSASPHVQFLHAFFFLGPSPQSAEMNKIIECSTFRIITVFWGTNVLEIL